MRQIIMILILMRVVEAKFLTCSWDLKEMYAAVDAHGMRKISQGACTISQRTSWLGAVRLRRALHRTQRR